MKTINSNTIIGQPYRLFSDVCPNLVVVIPACIENHTGIHGEHEDFKEEGQEVLKKKHKKGSFERYE